MNEQIMNWSSQAFYENKLVADACVATRTLDEIVTSNVETTQESLWRVSVMSIIQCPVVFIDTAGCAQMKEMAKLGGDTSICNPGEAAILSTVRKDPINAWPQRIRYSSDCSLCAPS